MLPLVTEHILPASVVYTDEALVYNKLGAKGYQHRRINHSAKVYVQGTVHTNTIEGFWSLLKNGLRGVYHSVSGKYLQTYVNEYTFRYNHRKDEAPMFDIVRSQVKKVRHGRYGQYAPVGD